MVSIVLQSLVLLLALVSVRCILLGRLRQHEEPDSNVVGKSPVLFPNPDSDKPNCKTDLGYPGRCVDIRQCYAARQAVLSHNHPVRCGWINNYIPRVCCHPDQVQSFKMVFRPYRRRNRLRMQ